MTSIRLHRNCQLSLVLAGALLLAPALAARAQSRPPVLPLSLETRTWRPCELDPGSKQVTVVPDSGALEIAGSLPGSFGAAQRCWQDWSGYRRLTFRLLVPKGFPSGAELQVYLKDSHYYWYQAYPLRNRQDPKKRLPLTPGQWMTFTLSLRPFSPDWEPGGHQKTWYDATYRPKEFGVRLFSAAAWTGSVRVAGLALEDYQAPLGRTPVGTGGPGALPAPAVNAAQVAQHEKFELTWPVDQVYENPYDPAVVEVEGHFLSPSGQAITIPGFFYQGFTRSKSAEGYERLTPVGGPQWKVRFAPREGGRWRYYVQVRDALGIRKSPEGQFAAGPPKNPRGLARVSKRDPRYFEWENGEYLYPFAINMRDGGDQAEAQAGTYDFDRFFPLFRQAGITVVRTWMCAWWAGIEWSQKYHSRFADLGRYAQYNAWRLDYALDLAEQNDLYLEITLGSHGQLRQDKYDAEWEYNPYAVENGGFLPAPFMFFTSERAKAEVKRRYRYIAARWGYSRNIFSWDLWNEIDLSEGYYPPQVAAWHQEMARYLREVDQQPHLIVSHIALYWSAGEELWNLPEIEYIQSDSYWKRRDEGMNESFAKRVNYNKPFIFIEYGPQTAELPVPESRWLQEFRGGMWVSAMMPWSAPGAFWYQREWEQYRLAEYMKGLQAFVAGEDRRGKGYRMVKPTLTPETALRAQAMQNQDSARLYVYNWEGLGARSATGKGIGGVTVTLSGLKPGAYGVEFWDPVAGKVQSSQELACAAGSLNIPLPPVVADLAIKVEAR